MAKDSNREQTFKVYELQTQLYDTYGQPLIDIDVLKKRLDELHTPTKEDEEKKRGPELRNYAYVIHDRDFYTQDDEDEAASAIAMGSKRRVIKAGEKKPEHIHIELQLRTAKTAQALIKWISCAGLQVPMQWVVYVRENRDGEAATFDDKCAYLCHEREPDKAPYRYDEIMCTFDYEEMMKRYILRQARKSKSKMSRAFQTEHINKIASGEETVAGFISQFGYAVYEQNKAKYDHAEQYFYRTRYPGTGFRLTYLVTGPSTVGKTPLAKFLACSLFPEFTNPREVYFSVGDAGATLQGYNGQPVIIWDDWRAIDFIRQFGREKVFSGLFAVHPDPTDFNIKYGSVVLRHTVNIVTCIDSVNVFARELAGEYTDRLGNFHKGENEQILQAYKRIWGISEVTEEEISVRFNMGYYSNAALVYYQQYELALVIQNNTRAIAEKYSPSLYGHVGKRMLPVVGEKYREYLDRETKKITDPAMIDDDDIPKPLPIYENGDLPPDKYEEVKRKEIEAAELYYKQLAEIEKEREKARIELEEKKRKAVEAYKEARKLFGNGENDDDDDIPETAEEIWNKLRDAGFRNY